MLAIKPYRPEQQEKKHLKVDYSNTHAAVVEGCRTGNRIAQKELYGLYSKAMLNLSYRIINDKDEAEDVLQESFIDVFTKIDTFRGDSSIGAWIKRIVTNKSINAAKRLNKLNSYTEHTTVDAEDDTDLEYEQRFEADVSQIKEAIKELPDGYRIVFTLFLLEGYSHKEIAEVIGTSESNSKSQYNRAKKKIREIIENKRNYE